MIVYKAVQRANERVPSHSAVLVPDMVYILPWGAKLPLTDKGTVFRKGVNSVFDDEIKQLYGDNNNKHDIDRTVEEPSVKG